MESDPPGRIATRPIELAPLNSQRQNRPASEETECHPIPSVECVVGAFSPEPAERDAESNRFGANCYLRARRSRDYPICSNSAHDADSLPPGLNRTGARVDRPRPLFTATRPANQGRVSSRGM